MNIITRRLEFDAGHRVLGHEGKCRNLHGHRYCVEVSVSAPAGLDGLGRVIDFGIIKTRLGGWIDENLDHNMLLHPDDPLVQVGTAMVGRLPWVMENGNPTAENIAALVYIMAVKLLPELKVHRVRVYETPNCWADYKCQ